MAAVVLAAGAATRFGAPKQRILLPWVLARLAASPVDEVVVVEGAYGLSVDSAQAALRLVHCDDWERRGCDGGPGEAVELCVVDPTHAFAGHLPQSTCGVTSET